MESKAATEHQGEYAGQHFHFCSDKCQKKFTDAPGRYAHTVAAADHMAGEPGNDRPYHRLLRHA